MTPYPFTWPTWIPFWLVFVWAFAPEFRIVNRATPKADASTSQDKGSMQVLLLVQSLGMLAAFLLAPRELGQLPRLARIVCFWTGLALLVAGSLLRRHCWRMLGESFTGDVRTRPEQQVIDRGAYAWLRHPSYTAGVLMFTGIGVALGNWLGMLVLSPAAFVSYLYRMRVEERALEAALGEPYRAFLRTRKRLIPFVY